MSSNEVETRIRVVVGVDGSEPSKEALRWAARIAGTAGHIEAVTAWDYPTSYGWPTLLGDWQPDADAEKLLVATVDEVFGADRPVGLTTRVVRGHARDVLLETSADADMLVVGSRGHGGFAGLLLGSVSAACAEHSTRPVLVVHAPRSS